MRGHIINNVSGEEFKLCLRRECLTKPWGFRLQGGSDIGFPLTVQRVFSGSPAEGVLHRGDIVLQIDNLDASHILHKEAQDLVRLAGNELLLYLKRSPGARTSSAPSRSNSQDLTPVWNNNHTSNSPAYSSMNRAPMRHQSRASFQPSNRGSNSFANHNGNNSMMTQSLNFPQNDRQDNEEIDDPYVYAPVSERKRIYQNPTSQRGFSSAPRINRSANQFSFNQRSQSNPIKAPMMNSSTRWQPNQRSTSSPNYRQTATNSNSSSSGAQWQPNRNPRWAAPDNSHNQPVPVPVQATPAWQQKSKWPLENPVVTPWQPHGNSSVVGETDSRRQSKTSITLTPSYQPTGSTKQLWPPQREEPVHQRVPRGTSYSVPVRTVVSNDRHQPQRFVPNMTHQPASYNQRPLNVAVPPNQSSTSHQNGMTIIENYHPLEMSRTNFYPAYPAYMNVRRNNQGTQSFPTSPNYAHHTPTYVRQEPLYQHKRSTRALSVEPDGGVKPNWYSTGAPQYSQSSQPSPSQWTSSANLHTPSHNPSYYNSMVRPRRELPRHQRGTSVPYDWEDAPPPPPSVFSQSHHQHYNDGIDVNASDYDWSKSELARLIHQEDMRQHHQPRGGHASPEKFEPVAYRQHAPKIRTINRSSWGPGQHQAADYNYRNSAEFEGTEF